jgi:solute:Na+ symporter, SSS family
LISAQLFIYLQAVQAYVSPPIAVCFIFGILWPRMNSQGAISSLLSGFVLGSVRFILEVMDKTRHFTSSPVRWLLDMNFLHYAIFMFVVCTAVLIAVSLMTPAPERRKLAGLTFATVQDKIDLTEVRDPAILLYKPPPEKPYQHRLNVAFSCLLAAIVIGLWIYFR